MSAGQSQALLSFPTLDGRYLKWFQSHIEDWKIIKQAGEDAGAAFIRIWSDRPTGASLEAEPLSDQQIQAVIADVSDAGVQEYLVALPQVLELGERLGGLGNILAKLPEILKFIETLKTIIPQIQALIPVLKDLFGAFGGTPAPGSVATNPDAPPKF